MRKEVIILFLTICFMYPALGQPLIELQHEQHFSGETIFGTIHTENGTFAKEISKEDMKLTTGKKEVFLEHDIMFYNNSHYFYIYTSTPQNFTLTVGPILYKEEGILKETTLIQNFSITENSITLDENTTYEETLSIKPGFVFTLEDLPIIILENTGTGNISVTLNDEKEELLLEAGMTFTETYTPEQEFSLFTITSYKEFLVPVAYLGFDATFTAPDSFDLRPEKEVFGAIIEAGKKVTQDFTFFNFAEENITILEISSDLDSVSFESFDMLGPKETTNITLVFEEPIANHYVGTITIVYLQEEVEHTLTIPLSLFVLPPGIPVENFTVVETTCEELKGTICTQTQSCNGQSEFTKGNEFCCLDTCIDPQEQEESSGGISITIGIIIILLLAGIGYYFYRRSKKIKPEDAQKKIGEVDKNFTERMKGNTTKVVGKLDRT